MATISFSTTFNLALNPKQFLFEDTSDYVGQGILPSDVNGCFKITAPSGIVVYNNTDFSDGGCDIFNALSNLNQDNIQIPLNTSSMPEEGTYIILYTVYDANTLEYYTVTNTYEYTYERPTVEITQTVDCISPLFTSIDSTNYTVDGINPTITRTHTIDYPYGSAGEGTPTTGITATVTTTTFYNGTQTTEISSQLSYQFSNFIVIDAVSGVKEILVDCTDVCAIYCCIRSLEQQMEAYRTTNTVMYAETRTTFSQIMGLVGMVNEAIKCGKPDDVNGYLNLIKIIAHCTDDCSCSGDEPTQVTGLGGLVNEVIVQSGDAIVEVAAVTVGNTTTYTVTLNTTFISTVNNLYKTIVSAGDNVTVTDSGIIGGIRTFTVNAKKAIVAAGAGITVTPSAEVNGVITYTVAATFSMVADGEAGLIDFSINSGTYTLITDTATAALSAGTYLFWSEFTINVVATDQLTWSYFVNGVQQGLERTTSFTGGKALVAFNQKLIVGASEVVDVRAKRVSGAAAMPILSQSIQYIKIA